MATKQELIESLRRADLEGNEEYINILVDKLKAKDYSEPPKEEDGFLKDTLDVVTEAASGATRGLAQAADFFTTKPLNAISQLTDMATGGDGDVSPFPTFEEGTDAIGASQGNFMDEGLARDSIRKGSETLAGALGGGGLVRQAAKLTTPLMQAVTKAGSMPAMSGQGIGSQVLQTMGKGSTAAADLGYGTAEGVGIGLGNYLGDGNELASQIGGFVASPLAALDNKLTDIGRRAGSRIVKAISKYENYDSVPASRARAQENAENILGDTLQRSNMSSKEFINNLVDQGDQAVPADVAEPFKRLLREGVNESPALEARSKKLLDSRQGGAASRVADDTNRTILPSTARDESGVLLSPETKKIVGDYQRMYPDNTPEQNTALEGRITGWMDRVKNEPFKSVDDTAKSMSGIFKDDIDSLYDQSNKNFVITDKLANILSNPKNSVGQASKKIGVRIQDALTMGDKMTTTRQLDIIKQQLDAETIRAMQKGNSSRVRDLVRIKKEMLSEIDKANPEYAEARKLFSDTAALRDAGEFGGDFMKTSGSDLSKITSDYTMSQKHMYKVGAREAILNALNDANITSDATKKILGKNGSVDKLKSLYGGNTKEFKDFKSSLEREAGFMATRRSAQGNSTSAKQLIDRNEMHQNIQNAVDIFTPSGLYFTLNRLVRHNVPDIGKTEVQDAMAKVGDVLLTRINPTTKQGKLELEELRNMLRSKNMKDIKKALELADKKPVSGFWASYVADNDKVDNFIENDRGKPQVTEQQKGQLEPQPDVYGSY